MNINRITALSVKNTYILYCINKITTSWKTCCTTRLLTKHECGQAIFYPPTIKDQKQWWAKLLT